jgi:hypothetical protein
MRVPDIPLSYLFLLPEGGLRPISLIFGLLFRQVPILPKK